MSHHFLSTLLVALATLATTRPALAASAEQALLLDGTYDYVLHGLEMGSNALFRARYNFTIALQGCSWVITCEPLPIDGITQNPLEARTISAYDGHDIYTLRFQNQRAVQDIWGKRYESVKEELPGAMVSIFPGDYPAPRDSTVQHLWLAFASHCRFAEPRGRAKPPFVPDISIFLDPDYVCDYYWTNSSGHPDDRILVLFSNGRVIGRDAKGNLVKGSEPPPYDRGYTNGIGRWGPTTNIGGLRVPLAFEFTAFVPSQGGRAPSDLRAGYTYRCAVTNVSLGEMPEIPPRLPGKKVLVADQRLAKSGHATIPYPVTNVWLLTNDPHFELLAKGTAKLTLEEEVKRGYAKTPRAKVPRVIVVVFLALPFGIVVAARLLRLRNKLSSKTIQ